jgi:uncharacterized protein (UPF0212 family)
VIGSLLLAGSQDSERTVNVVVVEEATTLVDQPSIDYVQVEDAMTMVEYPATSAAGVCIAQDTALVAASTSSPSPSL